MAKLVVLSAGLNGQTYELKVDRTTVGRVDDNTFQIAQSSVSSHHCEVLLRGNDVVIKDLNSTNGTFINNQPITGEAVLKHGQTLRLGEVEMRLDHGEGSSGPADPAAAASAAAAAARRPSQTGSTMLIDRGVKVEHLGKDPGSLDTAKGEFTKKTNKTNLAFIIGAIVLLIVIVVAILVVLQGLNNKPSSNSRAGVHQN